MSNLISTPSMAMGEWSSAESEAVVALKQQTGPSCHMHHGTTAKHQQMSMHAQADNGSASCDDTTSDLCKIQCQLSACSAMLLGLSSHLTLPNLENDTPAFNYSRVFPKQQPESLYRPPLIG